VSHWIQGDGPFSEFMIYGPVSDWSDGGRRKMFLRPIFNGVALSSRQTTTSYARYMMSVHVGRILLRSEEVDHIDGNKLNDALCNFQILSGRENRVKFSRERGRAMVTLECSNCGSIFTRVRSNTHLCKPGQSYTACTRRCSAILSHQDPVPTTRIVCEWRK
jgi:hypothetical protein